VTTDEIMNLRAEVGFVTPLRPLEPGDRWPLLDSRGVYEFGLHPDDAFVALVHGIMVRGKLLRCEAVDVLPLQNAIQVRAKDPDRDLGFVPAAPSP
jgi:hypothetical protein